MITRDQVYCLLALHKRGDNILSSLPKEMFTNEIYRAPPSSESKISRALELVASAVEEDVVELMLMLDKHPRLLLEAGNVVNRGGVEVRGVTPFEMALGEGDIGLARRISVYFDKIPDGDRARQRQLERYKIAVNNMFVDSSDDVISLLQLIDSCSLDLLDAALNKSLYEESELSKALNAFRDKYKPGIVKKPLMHFCYNPMLKALKFIRQLPYDRSDELLYQSKLKVMLIQVVGFLQLALPAIDRFAFANHCSKDGGRSLKFLYNWPGEFKDYVASDISCMNGLGFDYLIYGWSDNTGLRTYEHFCSGHDVGGLLGFVEALLQKKQGDYNQYYDEVCDTNMIFARLG